MFRKSWGKFRENVGKIWGNLSAVCYAMFFFFICLCWTSLFFIHCFHSLLQLWFLSISFGLVLVLIENVFGHTFQGFFFLIKGLSSGLWKVLWESILVKHFLVTEKMWFLENEGKKKDGWVGFWGFKMKWLF